MAYKVGPLEHELTQRCFDADRRACEARRNGDLAQYERLRGEHDAYAEAARLAEDYGA